MHLLQQEGTLNLVPLNPEPLSQTPANQVNRKNPEYQNGSMSVSTDLPDRSFTWNILDKQNVEAKFSNNCFPFTYFLHIMFCRFLSICIYRYYQHSTWICILKLESWNCDIFTGKKWRCDGPAAVNKGDIGSRKTCCIWMLFH